MTPKRRFVFLLIFIVNCIYKFNLNSIIGNKYEIRSGKFIKNFLIRTFPHPGLCSKPNDEIVNFTRLGSGEYRPYSKPPYLLVINDDPSS